MAARYYLYDVQYNELAEAQSDFSLISQRKREYEEAHNRPYTIKTYDDQAKPQFVNTIISMLKMELTGKMQIFTEILAGRPDPPSAILGQSIGSFELNKWIDLPLVTKDWPATTLKSPLSSLVFDTVVPIPEETWATDVWITVKETPDGPFIISVERKGVIPRLDEVPSDIGERLIGALRDYFFTTDKVEDVLVKWNLLPAWLGDIFTVVLDLLSINIAPPGEPPVRLILPGGSFITKNIAKIGATAADDIVALLAKEGAEKVLQKIAANPAHMKTFFSALTEQEIIGIFKSFSLSQAGEEATNKIIRMLSPRDLQKVLTALDRIAADEAFFAEPIIKKAIELPAKEIVEEAGEYIAKETTAVADDLLVRAYGAENIGSKIAANPKASKLYKLLVPQSTQGFLTRILILIFGADVISNWLASDNITSGSGYTLNELADAVKSGAITKERALTEIKNIQEWKDYATNFISISGIANPLLWLFRPLYMINTEKAQLDIDIRKAEIEALEEKPAGVTKLDAKTTPAGAKIYIDDVYTFEVTPTVIGDISLGDHKITFKLDGYEDLSVLTPFEAGLINYQEQELIPIAGETDEQYWARIRAEQEALLKQKREEEAAYWAQIYAEQEERRKEIIAEQEAYYARIKADAEAERKTQQEAEEAYWAQIKQARDDEAAAELERQEAYWTQVNSENEARRKAAKEEDLAYWDNVFLLNQQRAEADKVANEAYWENVRLEQEAAKQDSRLADEQYWAEIYAQRAIDKQAERAADEQYWTQVYRESETEQSLTPAGFFPAVEGVPILAPVSETELVLNIETSGLYPWDSTLISIGMAATSDINMVPTILIEPDEKLMLTSFFDIIKQAGVKKLIGYSIGFDFRYLIIKAMKYNLTCHEFYACNLYDLAEAMAKGRFEYVFMTQKTPSLSDIAAYLWGYPKPFTDLEMIKAWQEGAIDKVTEFASSQVRRTLMLYLLFRNTTEITFSPLDTGVSGSAPSSEGAPLNVSSVLPAFPGEIQAPVDVYKCPVCLAEISVPQGQAPGACAICKNVMVKL